MAREAGRDPRKKGRLRFQIVNNEGGRSQTAPSPPGSQPKSVRRPVAKQRLNLLNQGSPHCVKMELGVHIFWRGGQAKWNLAGRESAEVTLLPSALSRNHETLRTVTSLHRKGKCGCSQVLRPRSASHARCAVETEHEVKPWAATDGFTDGPPALPKDTPLAYLVMTQPHGHPPRPQVPSFPQTSMEGLEQSPGGWER